MKRKYRCEDCHEMWVSEEKDQLCPYCDSDFIILEEKTKRVIIV
jgi:Zn finger protein HypA/HybF involved in hydrogenase expression